MTVTTSALFASPLIPALFLCYVLIPLVIGIVAINRGIVDVNPVTGGMTAAGARRWLNEVIRWPGCRWRGLQFVGAAGADGPMWWATVARDVMCWPWWFLAAVVEYEKEDADYRAGKQIDLADLMANADAAGVAPFAPAPPTTDGLDGITGNSWANALIAMALDAKTLAELAAAYRLTGALFSYKPDANPPLIRVFCLPLYADADHVAADRPYVEGVVFTVTWDAEEGAHGATVVAFEPYRDPVPNDNAGAAIRERLAALYPASPTDPPTDGEDPT